MIELFLRKLRIRDDVSPGEVKALLGLLGDVTLYSRRAQIVGAGQRQTCSRLLVDGWVAREKIVTDGRRQISEVHIPGDFVDLHSFLLKRLEHDVVALTPCRIINVEHDRLKSLSETYPHLTRLLWLTTLMDAAIHREWIATMGRMPAAGHLAHFLCEMYLRLEAVGLAQDYQFEFPLTQEELGDICGLTAVHTNRVVQDLRGRKLIKWSGQRAHILDWGQLCVEGQFHPLYLNLWKEPR